MYYYDGVFTRRVGHHLKIRMQHATHSHLQENRTPSCVHMRV